MDSDTSKSQRFEAKPPLSYVTIPSSLRTREAVWLPVSDGAKDSHLVP